MSSQEGHPQREPCIVRGVNGTSKTRSYQRAPHRACQRSRLDSTQPDGQTCFARRRWADRQKAPYRRGSSAKTRNAGRSCAAPARIEIAQDEAGKPLRPGQKRRSRAAGYPRAKTTTTRGILLRPSASPLRMAFSAKVGSTASLPSRLELRPRKTGGGGKPSLASSETRSRVVRSVTSIVAFPKMVEMPTT